MKTKGNLKDHYRIYLEQINRDGWFLKGQERLGLIYYFRSFVTKTILNYLDAEILKFNLINLSA